MKKGIKIGVLVLTVVLIGVFLVWFLTPSDTNTKLEDTGNPQGMPLSEEELLKQKVSQMNLDDKIGQLFMISVTNTKMTDALKTKLSTLKPGGVILFKDNITTYADTSKLIQDMQAVSDIPLLMGIDQEGGKVQRIKALSDAEVLTVPPMMTVGDTDNADLAYQVGKVLGEEIAAFGFNLDFAPVIDVYSNPNNTVIGNRSFGTTADRVIKMAFPVANGLKDSGVIPVYKHFPGHGDTEADSHYDLPVIKKTKEELNELELLPFKKAIEEKADVMMIAHLALPSITGDDTPSSVSKKVVNDWLREELGYDGVIITDAVNMKALSDRYSTKEIAVKAIDAGVDIVLMPDDLAEAKEGIKEAINDGTLTMEQVDKAVYRVLRLKSNYHLEDEKQLDKSVIGSEEHKKVIDSIK